VSIRHDNDLWDRMRAYCHLRRITLINATDHWTVEYLSASSPNVPLDHMEVCITSDTHRAKVVVPLVGTFQLDNISIACTLAGLWARQHLQHLSREDFAAAVTSGLQSTKWPGRFQLISQNPAVIIDVGHTADACARLVQSIKTFLPQDKVLLVTGVSADKAVEDILRILTPIADEIICTRAHHKGESVQRVFGVVSQLVSSINVWQADTIEEAALLARQIATSQAMTVVVAGGLFLAIEFRTAWEGMDPRLLRFY
jgi:dihydrofolate synthase / folylpolyglutamate synthase